MKIIICSVALILTMTGCGFGVRENMIRNQRPISLKTYNGGPVAVLTQGDIDEAVEFGKNNKHNQEVLDYAFMFAKDSSRLLEVNPRTLYVLVCTNYYLISDYIAKQNRNYENIDMDYVSFLSRLPTFKLEVVEKMGDVVFPFQAGTKFVLLKNGEKLEESKENPLYGDYSPYAVSHLSQQLNWQEAINESVKQSIEMTNKIAESYQKGTQVNYDNTNSLTTQPAHLYDYVAIDLNSKYEVVVIYNDREIKVPLNFSQIK